MTNPLSLVNSQMYEFHMQEGHMVLYAVSL